MCCSINIKNKFNEKALNEIDKTKFYYDKIDEYMQNGTAIYKGKVIDFLFQPLFYAKEDIGRLTHAVEMMKSIINKTVASYLNDDEVRKLFGFSSVMEDLIRIDAGFDDNCPFARFDIFYQHNDDYKFCELNGDGSSAMNEANTLEEAFLNSGIFEEYLSDIKLENLELFESAHQNLINLYREFGGTKSNPTIAIMDFKGLGTQYEFERFQSVFEKLGSKTLICDPRDFEYLNNKLIYKGEVIDLIYRRAVNRELEERISDVENLIEAYKNKDVCLVGSFKSEIMHNKVFFSVIHNPLMQKYLSDEEISFIKKHVPFTIELEKLEDDDLINDRKNWVLKPANLYAARGVYFGVDYNDQEWKDLIKDCHEKNDYLVQEFCIPTPKEVIHYENGKFETQTFNSTLGLYVYGGKLSGLYSRLGRMTGISGLHEVYTAANFII
jgi:hypothetical protein